MLWYLSRPGIGRLKCLITDELTYIYNNKRADIGPIPVRVFKLIHRHIQQYNLRFNPVVILWCWTVNITVRYKLPYNLRFYPVVVLRFWTVNITVRYKLLYNLRSDTVVI